MNASCEKLRLAFAYIDQVGEALDRGVGEEHDPWARSAARQELKEKLKGARELLAELERDAPDVSAPYGFSDGTDVTITLPHARASSYRVEAVIMATFYDDHRAAIDLASRAIAIQPEDATLHAMLTASHAELGEFDKAVEAIERALSLDPDNLDYRAALDQLKRHQAERAGSAAEPRARWRLGSWFN